ncbi:MAG: NUDIX hydrolase [Anaerolineales bacterium]
MSSPQAIQYCTQCGHPVEIRVVFGKPRPVCSNCGHIHFQDPKVASAALIVRDGRVLLVRRVNEPARGQWTLPAGFVDAGEDPAAAAERECLEETGLTVRVQALIDVIAGREHPGGADMVIIYSAEVIEGDLNPGDDADQAQFFPPEQLPALAFKATRQALNHWLNDL